MVSKHHACTSFGLKKKVEPALTALCSSQLAIVQTYTVQINGNSTASKAKKPSHGSHSISVYCDNTSANYCNIFAYLRITYNTSGACLNLPEWGAQNRTLAQANRVHKNTVAFGRKLLREIWCLKIDLYVIKANLSVLFQVLVKLNFYTSTDHRFCIN